MQARNDVAGGNHSSRQNNTSIKDDTGVIPDFSPIRREIPEIHYSLSLLSPIVNFKSNPLEVLNWVEKNYGSLASFHSPSGQGYLIVSDPEVLQQVLHLTDNGRSDSFDKSSLLQEGASWIIGDDSVLITSNQTWRQQRQIIAPFFKRTAFENEITLKKIKYSITKCQQELVTKIKASPEGVAIIDLQDEMSILALRVAMSCLFNREDVPRHELETVREASRVIHSLFPLETLFPGDIPLDRLAHFSSSALQLARSRDFMKSYVDKMVESLRNGEIEAGSFVNALVEAQQGQANGVSTDMVKHNVLALLFAGHETSGNVLGWLMGVISQRPELAEKLRSEANTFDEGIGFELKKIEAALPLTYQSLNEALRMYPPVYLLLRRASEDVKIETNSGTVLIPKDTEILLDVYNAQRNEQWWGKSRTGYPATIFQEERWHPNNIEKNNLNEKDLNLFVFGGGSRICMGANLFIEEALLAISAYLKAFKFESCFVELEREMRSDFTLQRTGGFPVRVSLHEGCDSSLSAVSAEPLI